MKIISGKGDERKLYDTDKATLLVTKQNIFQDIEALYVSNKGNYFILEAIKSNGSAEAKTINKEQAKDYVLKTYSVDKFIEVFGEVEEV